MALAHSTRGKVTANNGGVVVFKPTGTTYELHLRAENYTGPMNEAVDVIIRGDARKVYTVPSGGLFVSPIMGTPKIIQGRVKDVTTSELALHCGGAIINVTLPRLEGAIELAQGPIESGRIVNAVLMAGASID